MLRARTARSIGGRLSRLSIGPRRTAHERRLSLLGAAVGALLAAALGLAYLAFGVLTNPLWRVFPPPMAPFVLLPVAAGALAGLRFTTDLVRPPHMTWKSLLIVTAGIIVYTMTTLTAFAIFAMAFGNHWQTLAELATSILYTVVLIPVMAVVWAIVPGVLLTPLLAPAVAAFAFIMRRLEVATSGFDRDVA